MVERNLYNKKVADSLWHKYRKRNNSMQCFVRNNVKNNRFAVLIINLLVEKYKTVFESVKKGEDFYPLTK